MRSLVLAVAVVAVTAPGIARAGDPTFTYGKYEEKKAVEWKANASVGLLLTTGNSNNLSFSAAAMGSRNDGKNKLQLDVSGAYVRSTVLSANDANNNGVLDPGEIKRDTAVTTALWNVKLRYDRFFTANNTGYVTGFAWGNEPAGKKVVAGAQVGYSRQLYKTDMHLVVAEIGYDFSYERYLTGSELNYYLHSLRLYVGYNLSVSKDTAFLFDIEYLGNMNPYDGPYGANVGAFEDSRVYGRAALTTRLWKKLNFRLAFTARYDNVPAPQAKSAILGGLDFAPGFLPASEKLDTITDASLVVNFL
jgi:hypothetical protein